MCGLLLPSNFFPGANQETKLDQHQLFSIVSRTQPGFFKIFKGWWSVNRQFVESIELVAGKVWKSTGWTHLPKKHSDSSLESLWCDMQRGSSNISRRRFDFHGISDCRGALATVYTIHVFRRCLDPWIQFDSWTPSLSLQECPENHMSLCLAV